MAKRREDELENAKEAVLIACVEESAKCLVEFIRLLVRIQRVEMIIEPCSSA